MATDDGRLPTWCPEDDWCPMVAAAGVLGRKWHPVIIHRLSEHDPLGFGELEARIQGVSGKVLSESLTDLEDKGLVKRDVVETKPVRVEYSLTRHGHGLETAVDEFHQWGREYLKEVEDPKKSII